MYVVGRREMKPKSPLMWTNKCMQPPSCTQTQTTQNNKHRTNMLSLHTQASKHTKPRYFSKLPAGS